MTSVPVHSALSAAARWLVAAAACMTASAMAQVPAPSPPTVSVTASATATVINDRLQAWLRAEADNASATAAASQVNATIASALATAKAFPSVKVATAGYSTQQISDKLKAQRWRVMQTINLDASDFTAAAALISRLQDEHGLLLSGMGFSLADKTRRDAEDSVTQQALQKWQARAQQAARGLGFVSAKPAHVTVQTGDGGHLYPMPRAQAMASSAGGVPIAIEGGTTEVTVTVSGEAVLQ